MRISDWSSDVCSSDLRGHFGAGGFRSGEGQQPPRQVGGAVGAVERVGEVALRLFGRIGKPALRQLEPADDDRQHIVEIMRDAAGQLADGFHLLRLAQLRLRLLAVDHLRSEEQTSELQSLMRNSYAVICLNKKKILKIIQRP